MKRYLILAGVAAASFVLGAVCVLYLKRATDSTVPKAWITVVPESYRIVFNSAAMRADIPLPALTGPEGRVKFLIRDKGIQLGYVLKVPIKPLPVSSLPKKYQKTTQENGYTYGPAGPSNVHWPLRVYFEGRGRIYIGKDSGTE
jgi:hypothetical protein